MKLSTTFCFLALAFSVLSFSSATDTTIQLEELITLEGVPGTMSEAEGHFLMATFVEIFNVNAQETGITLTGPGQLEEEQFVRVSSGPTLRRLQMWGDSDYYLGIYGGECGSRCGGGRALDQAMDETVNGLIAESLCKSLRESDFSCFTGLIACNVETIEIVVLSE